MTTPTLSQVGGQHLEYVYLSALTGDPQYRARVERIRAFLRDIPKPDGLYLKNVYVEEQESKGLSDMSTLAKSAGHFYSYLLKSYLQSGGRDETALEMYKEAMDAAERMQLITVSNRSGLAYARNYHPSERKYGDYMNYDACYLGGMLVQGYKLMGTTRTELRRAERHWRLAGELTETCHQASNGTVTRLPPHHFYFTPHEDATNVRHDHKHKVFHLR
jgi:mannosyl-oligosaccharide alpha-1,2-mannosidase